MPEKGILLINIGTPDNSSAISIYHYLKQFLSDPRVVDLNYIIRWFFVNFVILPWRSRKSANAYRKIWMKEGSPLLVHSNQLKAALALELGKDYQVEIGMRYGNPSIHAAYHKLRECKTLTVIPLFPQYTAAATGSAIANLLAVLNKEWDLPQQIFIKNAFYKNAEFISAYANIISHAMVGKKTDLLLFSYHGLPLRHLIKSGCQAACDNLKACFPLNQNNNNCYRAQCFETSRLLAEALELKSHQYKVCFQSRLGKTPWIKPYTDLLLPELFQQGIRNIAVACPSFVTDCLETLEEVNIRAREQWLALGGEEFIFVPCLNTHSAWVKALGNIVKEAT